MFDALERVRIFIKNDVRFSYITYKSDRSALLAMTQFNAQTSTNFGEVQLADACKQPDNPLDATESPFQNLIEDCLIHIF